MFNSTVSHSPLPPPAVFTLYSYRYKLAFFIQLLKVFMYLGLILMPFIWKSHSY